MKFAPQSKLIFLDRVKTCTCRVALTRTTILGFLFSCIRISLHGEKRMRLRFRFRWSCLLTFFPDRRCWRTECNRSVHGLKLKNDPFIAQCRFIINGRKKNIHDCVWFIWICSVEILFWSIDWFRHFQEKSSYFLFVPSSD